MIELVSRKTGSNVKIGGHHLNTDVTREYEVLVIDPIRRMIWAHMIATGFRDWLKADYLDCYWDERVVDPPVVIREPWESDERYRSRCELASLLKAEA